MQCVFCTQYAVQCTMYIYFVHTFYIYPSIPYYLCVQCNVYIKYIYIYTGYTINICCVKCIHYKYIVDVLKKTIRRIEMIDHSFERKFYGACYYRLY